MEKNDLNLLQAVIETLGDVTVKGYDNMTKIVGCINALQKIIQNCAKESSDG